MRTLHFSEKKNTQALDISPFRGQIIEKMPSSRSEFRTRGNANKLRGIDENIWTSPISSPLN